MRIPLDMMVFWWNFIFRGIGMAQRMRPGIRVCFRDAFIWWELWRGAPPTMRRDLRSAEYLFRLAQAIADPNLINLIHS